MSVPQIMVCCPTYAKSADTATILLQGLAEQTYPNLVFVFCDTTAAAMPGKTYDKLPELLQKFLPGKLTVTLKTMTPPGAPPHQIITEAREQLRQYFLQSNAEYLFFVDDDIQLPKDAIEKLASHKRQVMVGAYLNPMVLREGKDPEIAPCAWVDIPPELGLPDVVRPLFILDVMPARIIPITISGFGCSLFHRSVMDMPFVYDPQSRTSEDTPFFMQLRKKGIQALLDTRVKCKHYKFHPLDERNSRLDFNHYKLQFVP